MGPAARSAGNCPGLRKASVDTSADGLEVEPVPAMAPDVKKIVEEERIEAAKEAGYLVHKNGTVTWPGDLEKRNNGAPRGFTA